MVRDDKHLEQRGMKVSRRWAECMCVKESEVRRKDKAVRSRVVKKNGRDQVPRVNYPKKWTVNNEVKKGWMR